MSERDWNFVNSISYLYNTFAIYTDAELQPEERQEIQRCVQDWCPELTKHQVKSALNTTLAWFKEDLREDLDNKDNQAIAKNCYSIALLCKEQLSEENCKAIYNDLISIGKADGNFDAREQHWVQALGDAMGLQ